MGKRDRRIDIYIQKASQWQNELRALRLILVESPLDETLKWRQPVYTHNDENVAIVWNFKDACGLGFFKGALLKDELGLLVAPGEHSRSARKLPFTSVAEIEASRATIEQYIAEAVALADEGAKVPPREEVSTTDYPTELAESLATDAILREAFEALTPGRRRYYVIHFSEPKKAETRRARIERARPKILQGKGVNER